MKILFVLTYYRPHVSGLTIYVERLAKALAERGHQVTVLTSHFAKQLPYEEVQGGVRIVRTPVLFRFNKGVFMPRFSADAWREMRAADVVSIHLPQVEATLSAALARLVGRRPLLTYHCDLQMPPGLWYGPLVDAVTYQNNILAGRLADTIVAYTHDFASHSPVLSRFLAAGDTVTRGHDDKVTRGHDDKVTRGQGDKVTRGQGDKVTRGQGDKVTLEEDSVTLSPVHLVTRSHHPGKVRVILPPVVIPEPTTDGARALREQYGLNGRPVIGFAARFAYEKGASFLLEAIPHVLARFPDAHLLFAGPYLDVVGERVWYDLQPLIKRYESHLTFLGTLNPAQMADFFAACDVITVASINNTESFGLVQVEAFMCGTPVVATDLPGVRQPVRMTGMGEIVPVADARGLAEGIIKVLADPAKYIKPRGEIMQMFELARTVEEYEKLFEEKRSG